VSLYRKPGGVGTLTLVLAAAVALVIGGAIGYAIGHSDDDRSSARDVVSSLGGELRPVADGLDLLPTEYRQAYGGTGNESAGVRGALERIRSSLAGVRGDLQALDRVGTRALDLRIAALVNAVQARRPPAKIALLVERARAALLAVPGGHRP
jgi:hypothetical protein